MNINHDPSHLSLLSAFRSIARRSTSCVMLLFLLLLGFYSLLFSVNMHRSACNEAKIKLEQFTSTLGREIALGEISVAHSIFADLKKAIAQNGNSEQLQLELTSSQTADSALCRISPDKAFISAPIFFDGKIVAIINGTVRNILVFQMLVVIFLTALILLVFLLLWNRRLGYEIEMNFIEPIRAISEGKRPSLFPKVAREVFQLVDNLEKLQAQLLEQQRQNLELAKTKELSEIAVQVAHDIRSPLSALSLISKSAKHLSPDQMMLLTLAEERIRKIAEQLLTKYRFNSFRPPEADKSISSVVNAIVAEKRLLHPYVKFDTAIEESAGLKYASIDHQLLSQALSNLIDNAIEAQANSILIGVLGSQEAIGNLEIYVKDSGQGIPQDQLPLLGGEGATFGKKNGIGLGLYTVKKSVTRAGGELKIDSRVDKGTHVTLRLPARAFSGLSNGL